MTGSDRDHFRHLALLTGTRYDDTAITSMLVLLSLSVLILKLILKTAVYP